MSRLIKKHWSYLQLLMNTTSKQQRKQLLETIINDQLRALTEVVVNLLQRILPITPSHKSKLKRHRNIIRRLGDTTISSKKKKILLCGGDNTYKLPHAGKDEIIRAMTMAIPLRLPCQDMEMSLWHI